MRKYVKVAWNHVLRKITLKPLSILTDVEWLWTLKDSYQSLRNSIHRHRPRKDDCGTYAEDFAKCALHLGKFNTVAKNLDLLVDSPKICHRGLARWWSTDKIACPEKDASVRAKRNKGSPRHFWVVPISPRHLWPRNQKFALLTRLDLPQV